MATPTLKPGQKVFINVDWSGFPTGAAPYVGTIAPRGQGYWVDVTDSINACCTTSTTTTTTTTAE